MVVMARNGHWLRMLFGYVIGMELALAAVYVGEACAFWISSYLHPPSIISEDDAVWTLFLPKFMCSF